MSSSISLDDIKLFKSVFKGRNDVFAVRWEKSGKSGYMPAYQYDLYHYRAHKMNGGTFQNYPHKTCLSLTEIEIHKHLDGIQQIGIYPLLEDNTSWFLVADFDKQNWKEDAVNFLNACKEKNIPAYLERSRSGNGGHVWMYFTDPILQSKAEKFSYQFWSNRELFRCLTKVLALTAYFQTKIFFQEKV